ncbi:uncharacterized protein LY79DRAFT_695042 [Colletotrichum navitas]|uniref:Uncharacterized protein n=1 Tax=Colletotrichum navitas TaxID=681940 RepID=A0AAD8V1R9_9PEZI|nr:uncharacterized protein LY79DRAFT_695042 [Colletotrichum navitas]KAK1574649.1 hypothetical protein LY79DRAFT_695042 [Colletotrichum navitas]
MSPLLISLLASSTLSNLIIIDKIDFIVEDLVNYLMYLISAVGIKALLSCSSSSQSSIKSSISIKLVCIPYTRIP